MSSVRAGSRLIGKMKAGSAAGSMDNAETTRRAPPKPVEAPETISQASFAAQIERERATRFHETSVLTEHLEKVRIDRDRQAAEIQRLTAELTAARTDLAQQQHRADVAEGYVEALRAQVDKIRESASWRAMAPMRRAKSFLIKR